MYTEFIEALRSTRALPEHPAFYRPGGHGGTGLA